MVSEKERRYGLTGGQLKVLALITMAVDHVGAVLFPEYPVLRMIGRLSFPIYAFLLVEGFFHTRDVRRYFMWLLGFTVLSEIPYDLAFNETWFYAERQNIFFTLSLGLGVMWILEKSGEWPEKIVEILLAMWLAELVHADYGYRGILLILIFYVFRGRRLFVCAGEAVWNFLWISGIQRYGALAAFPIGLYNGKRGRGKSRPGTKCFFYVFYPVHLLVLYIIKRCLF